MGVRFAPSPTGAFHIGNFRSAWISRQWAKTLRLPWILRFEDIDSPRNVKDAQTQQLADMQSLGLTPDQVLVQSQFHDRHKLVFEKFLKANLVYPCFCSRKTVREAIESSASAPHKPTPLYSGQCRDLKNFPNSNLPSLAWRLKMPLASGEEDLVIARTSTQLDTNGKPDLSTFIPAYNWACAIDDYDGRYDLIVRAWDLADVTKPQRQIQKFLSELENEKFSFPAVFHCALVTQNDGTRLEKRTRGVTLSEILKTGESIPSILQKFEVGFLASTSEYSPGEIFGEEKKSITLAELGFGGSHVV